MLFLSCLLSLVPVALSAIYRRSDDLPNTTFDFIIVGGSYLNFSTIISLTNTLIIGGTAGSVLANRLTEIPQFQVLVIEAGPESVEWLNFEWGYTQPSFSNVGVMDLMVPGFVFNLANSAFDWNFTTTPQKGLNGRIVTFERGHVLGGSSSVSTFVWSFAFYIIQLTGIHSSRWYDIYAGVLL